MCEMKTVLVSVCLILLVTASFCMYWVYPDENVGQYSEIKIQGPCEIEYKKYCLNDGECYYLFNENIVGCKRTWFYGGKRCEKYMWWTSVRLQNKLFFQKIVRVFKNSISKSDLLINFCFKI